MNIYICFDDFQEVLVPEWHRCKDVFFRDKQSPCLLFGCQAALYRALCDKRALQKCWATLSVCWFSLLEFDGDAAAPFLRYLPTLIKEDQPLVFTTEPSCVLQCDSAAIACPSCDQTHVFNHQVPFASMQKTLRRYRLNSASKVLELRAS